MPGAPPPPFEFLFTWAWSILFFVLAPIRMAISLAFKAPRIMVMLVMLALRPVLWAVERALWMAMMLLRVAARATRLLATKIMRSRNPVIVVLRLVVFLLVSSSLLPYERQAQPQRCEMSPPMPPQSTPPPSPPPSPAASSTAGPANVFAPPIGWWIKLIPVGGRERRVKVIAGAHGHTRRCACMHMQGVRLMFEPLTKTAHVPARA